MDDDNLIAQFTSFTAASPQQAAQYLQLTEGNVEQAIQLYFDSPNLDLGGATAAQTSAAPPVPPASTRPVGSGYTEDEHGIVHIDSNDDEPDDDLIDMDVDKTDRTSNQPAAAGSSQPSGGAAYEDDEAMARRLQQEMYGEAGEMGGLGEEGVRAPMARTTETLIGPGSSWGSGGDELDAAVAEQMMARRRRAQGRPGIFNQHDTQAAIWEADGDPESRRVDLARATGGASEASTKSQTLAEMFRPPFEIMSRLSWDDARDEGKAEEKWIIVNIQDPAIFDCQVLNRDIWKNRQIRETIKENFLFMQYAKDDPRGSSYINYYFHSRDNDDAYPHIAIVDPRTGEQVKVWSGKPSPTPTDFLMDLHEFLDRYSLKVNVRNPVATRKPEKKPDVSRMSEEEMLEMALQASLANEGGQKFNDPDALTKDDAGKGKGKAIATDEETTSADESSAPNGALVAPSPFAQISSCSPHEEPANSPSTTRIQFRHSGGRLIRRFAITEPVRRMYEWLKASPLEGKEGVEFELIAMGKNLMDQLETTIEQAGLKNGTVMVEFVGDADDD